MICTPCQGTGFLNIEQVPVGIDLSNPTVVLGWMLANKGHDVRICDCCGDGEGWYHNPGEHASNALPECM